MCLDDRMVFKGEIAKACGGILGGVDAFGDVSSFLALNYLFSFSFCWKITKVFLFILALSSEIAMQC